MKTAICSRIQFRTVLSVFFFALVFIVVQGCKKTPIEPATDPATEDQGRKKNPHNPPPPPPPPPFYFSDCYNPTFAATFVKGESTNVTITKNYVNSPGGSYAPFTSTLGNGLTISTPAGTFNVGSGSVVFTVTGTPTNTGYYSAWISVGNIQPCMIQFAVTNAPASGPTVDPGPTPGSTGVVNFIYKGQAVAYTTVRAKDGKIWLQQNLGSPQVAFHHFDETSYGDYFQWGRWDDGHQAANSPVVTGGASLLNPSSIPSGYPNFIVGQTADSRWWGIGGLASDTWSGSLATSTNGKDPCVALGAGWRLPTAADWQYVKNFEDLDGVMAAHMSNLKLPAGGFRDAYGGYVYKGSESYYWTSTASANSYATGLFISDNTYSATLQASNRGEGFNCRCVKD